MEGARLGSESSEVIQRRCAESKRRKRKKTGVGGEGVLEFDRERVQYQKEVNEGREGAPASTSTRVW